MRSTKGSVNHVVLQVRGNVIILSFMSPVSTKPVNYVGWIFAPPSQQKKHIIRDPAIEIHYLYVFVHREASTQVLTQSDTELGNFEQRIVSKIIVDREHSVRSRGTF